MHLYREDELERNQLSQWQKEAIRDFAHKMTSDKKFPCIPATQAYALKHLRYGFVGSPTEKKSAEELATLLKTFSQHCRDFGKYTTLIVFYHTPTSLRVSETVEGFEHLFWEQLNTLRELDECEWPSHIPIDPEEPTWEFCFHGEQYFMYCATPVHKQRQSRHFPHMMMAITPRWVLQEFNKKPAYAKKIKHNIRKRLEEYDGIEPHPELKQYGTEDNFEWKQYFLHDTDTALSKCPFLQAMKAPAKENNEF